MENKTVNNSKKKDKLRIIIIVIIAVLAFLIAMLMNIVGISQVFNENTTDKSGLLIGFSTPNSTTTKNTVEKVKEIQEVSALTNSTVLVTLQSNNWDRLKSNFKNFEIDSDGTCTFEDGYTMYCNSTYVQYIIFNENYKKSVIGNIKVGDDFDKIKEELGEPAFSADNMIGYKTGDVYAFFYDDEIVVYSNGKKANNVFEEFIFEYYNGEYSGNRTNFVVEFKNKYYDFTAEMDGNDVVLTSITRQIKIKLLNDGGMEITLYNGYNLGTKMNSYLSEENILQSQDDLVEVNEMERLNA